MFVSKLLGIDYGKGQSNPSRDEYQGTHASNHTLQWKHRTPRTHARRCWLLSSLSEVRKLSTPDSNF